MKSMMLQPVEQSHFLPQSVAGNAGNSACFIQRIERRYEVALPSGRLTTLLRLVNRFIPLHEYTPGCGITHVKSVYFDTGSHALFHHDGLPAGHDMQVRMRTYD